MQEVRVLNLGRWSDYPDWGRSLFSSVLLRKFRSSASTRSLSVPFESFSFMINHQFNHFALLRIIQRLSSTNPHRIHAMKLEQGYLKYTLHLAVLVWQWKVDVVPHDRGFVPQMSSTPISKFSWNKTTESVMLFRIHQHYKKDSAKLNGN
jgi:hypothetical protein